jgi:hypothetical protein
MAVCISVTDDAHARDLVNFLIRSCGVDSSAFDKCPKIDSARQEDIHEVLGYFVPHIKTIFKQVEFEAECSFAILSSLWHSLCVVQTDSPNGLLVKVITPLAAAVASAASDASCIAGPSCIFRSLASLYNNAKGCMHAQVVCLQALFESAASSGNFAAVSEFYGNINKLCDAWGASIDISRALQLSAVKGLVAARKIHFQPVHTVLRAYLASFQGSSQDVLQSLRQYADILCIDVVSRLDVFQFDDFLSLDAIQVASPDLLRVLHCVAREDMKGLRKLQAEVPTMASAHGIDMKLLEEKMRLLSFASAASSKVIELVFCSNLVLSYLFSGCLDFRRVRCSYGYQGRRCRKVDRAGSQQWYRRLQDQAAGQSTLIISFRCLTSLGSREQRLLPLLTLSRSAALQ